jgi:hypothetical protein
MSPAGRTACFYLLMNLNVPHLRRRDSVIVSTVPENCVTN